MRNLLLTQKSESIELFFATPTWIVRSAKTGLWWDGRIFGAKDEVDAVPVKPSELDFMASYWGAKNFTYSRYYIKP